MRRLDDLLFDFAESSGCLFTALGTIALLLGTMLFFILTDHSERDFMAECQKDHKHYECVALWRQGERHSQVVPMPIVIPVR